jgi:hypothetical protein
MEISIELHARAALPRDKSPLYYSEIKLSGSQNQRGRYGEEKILSLPGIEPQLSSPIARRYTDWAIPTSI